jgi:hypothetical protein
LERKGAVHHFPFRINTARWITVRGRQDYFENIGIFTYFYVKGMTSFEILEVPSEDWASPLVSPASCSLSASWIGKSSVMVEHC